MVLGDCPAGCLRCSEDSRFAEVSVLTAATPDRTPNGTAIGFGDF